MCQARPTRFRIRGRVEKGRPLRCEANDLAVVERLLEPRARDESLWRQIRSNELSDKELGLLCWRTLVSVELAAPLRAHAKFASLMPSSPELGGGRSAQTFERLSPPPLRLAELVEGVHVEAGDFPDLGTQSLDEVARADAAA